MKTRAALYEEPYGRQIIHRDDSPVAFIVLDVLEFIIELLSERAVPADSLYR